MAKLKWWEIYNYKSNAAKYLEQEEARSEKVESWKKEQKSLKKVNEVLRKKATPATFETGMAGIREPETPEWYKVSQNVQNFDYERSINEEYEVSKRIFPGLKIPNFKETIKEKTSKPKPEEDLTSLLSMAGATPTQKKVWKYKTIDRQSNNEAITQQKEIDIVGENQFNYYYLKGGKIASIPKDECSEYKLSAKELELKFKENINNTAKSVEKNKQMQTSFKSTPEDLVTYESGFSPKDFRAKIQPKKGEGLIEYIKRQVGLLPTSSREAANRIGDQVFNILTQDQSIIGPIKNLGKLDTEKAKKVSNVIRDVVEGNLSTYTLESPEQRTAGTTIGELAGFVNPATPASKLFGFGEKVGTKLVGESAKKILPERILASGVKSGIGFGTYEAGTETVSYLKGKKITPENLKKSKEKVYEGVVVGGMFGVGGATVAETFKGSAKLVSKILTKMPKSEIKSQFSEFTAEKYGLNRNISKLSAQDKDAITKATTDSLLSSIGKDVTKKYNTKGPKKIFTSMLNDLGIDTKNVKITADLSLKGENRYAKAYVEKEGDKIVSITLKYNNAKPRDIIAGATAHEAKHVKDILEGHVIPSEKIMKKAKTVYDLLKNPEHHKGMESFEISYVEDLFKKDIEKIKSAPEININRQKMKGKLITKKQKQAKTYYDVQSKRIEQKTGVNLLRDIRTIEQMREIKQKTGIAPSRVIAAFMESKTPELNQFSIKGKKEFATLEQQKILKKIKAMSEAQEAIERLKPAETKVTSDGRTILTNSGEEISAELSLSQRVKKYLNKLPKRETVPLETANEIQWGEEKTPLELYRKFVDNNMIFKKIGKQLESRLGKKEAQEITRPSHVAATNYSKYHSTAATIQTNSLVGRDGRKILNESLLKVLDAGKNQKDFENYIMLQHHWARAQQDAPIFVGENGMALPRKQTKELIQKIEDQFPEFKKAGEDYVNWMDEFGREWLADNLISKELYAKLRAMYPYWAPSVRIMPGDIKAMQLNKISAKVLKYATGGAQNIQPISYSLPGYVERVVRTDRKNKIYLTLVEQIINSGGAMDDIAKIEKISNKLPQELKDKIKAASTGDLGYDNLLEALQDKLISTPSNGNFMLAMSRGEPILVKIENKQLWEALVRMEKTPASTEKELIRAMAKVTQVFKNAFTTYNPVFWAYRNIVRDMPTSYIQGAVDNPIKYAYNYIKSTAKISSFLLKHFTRIGPGSKTFDAYKALGAETSNFMRVEGKLTPNLWERFWNGVATIGNGTESIPRFAEFEQVYRNARKKGLPHERAIDEALYAAGEVTVDFSRHGDVMKVADAIYPYSNAKMQGTDKFIRTFLDRKLATTLKATGAVTLPTSVFYIMNKMKDPEGYANIPDYVKDNSYLIPLGGGKFWKVPKNEAYGVAFGTLFERIFRAFEKDPYAFKNLGATLRGQIILPQDFLSGGTLVPFQKVIIGANKDYFGRDIVPQYMLSDKRRKSLQKDERTSIGAEFIGEQFNASPKQIDFLIKSYLGSIGSLYFVFSTRQEGGWDKYFDRLGKNLGLTTTSDYGVKEMREQEEKDKAIGDVTDFEIEHGIKDLRFKLKSSGERSTRTINEMIYERLSPAEQKEWERLKKIRKQKMGGE